MKLFKIRLLILPSLILLSSLGFAVPAADNHGKIISLAPSVSKSLYLLGLNDDIIGITTFCPKKAKNAEIIGTLLEPNIEKILSMKPGLVIASKEGNLSQSVEKMKTLGLNVHVMKQAGDFDEICSEFVKLGEITGKKQKALEIVAESRLRINNLRAKTKGLTRPDLFWQIGTKPIFTVSSKGFVNDFILFAGAKNIFADVKTRFPQVSREEVIKRDPEIIILTAMGDESRAELKEWRGFKGMKAVEKGNIFIVDDDFFGEPTPFAIARGSEMIFDLIHGKAPEGKDAK